MKIKSVSLFMFLSLYTIQSYGMENNAENKTNKHAKNSKKRNLSISNICILLNNNKSKSLTLEENNTLQTSLKENMQLLEDCYSTEETWSVDDLNVYSYGEQQIKSLGTTLKH